MQDCEMAGRTVDKAWLADVVLAATGPDGTRQERQAAKAAAMNLFLHGMRDRDRVTILLKKPDS